MITVEQLSFTYPGASRPAITDLGFEIRPGEIFGFLGPSGAGKSTTQKLLIGLLTGYRGRISVLGRDRQRWGSDYYEHIGVCFEQPNHFSKLTGLENLAYFAGLYRRPTRTPLEALEMVGLLDAAREPVGSYSKGMQSRLNLARALLHRPELLFLDEPTSGQDPLNARRVRQLIRAQRDAGATVFLTTHDMSVADELCDRVAFLVDGQIPIIDPPRALKLRYGRAVVRVEYRAEAAPQLADFALDGLGDDAGFLSLLRSGAIQTIHTQEATLEDIFVEVTGRGLS